MSNLIITSMVNYKRDYIKIINSCIKLLNNYNFVINETRSFQTEAMGVIGTEETLEYI